MAGRNGTLDPMLDPLLDPLYFLALDMTGNSADAEDVTQEALLKAVRGYTTFHEGGNFKAWIYRILTNTVIDFYRKRKVHLAFRDADEDSNAKVEKTLPGSLATEDVEAALGDLDAEQRLTVLLIDVHEFSIQQTAEMLQCPAGTVGSRLARGRTTLRRRLTK